MTMSSPSFAATNALNDVFAMGGRPLLALSIAEFPEDLPQETVAAILSAADNSDAALVIANADSTGRTKRERLVKANPFLEHFTVADLKVWADRKMRGPNLRLGQVLAADARP
jgi:hydrogenase maturation factor